MGLRRHRQQLPKRQRGAVAVVVGIAIFVLVGMIGLALDLGQMFVNKTELQNAADACALAAARELDGTVDALTRADAAGETVARRNLVGFQKAWDDRIQLSLSYSEHLSPNTEYGPNPNPGKPSGSAKKAKFAMCTVVRSGIGMWFMGVRGFGDQTVAAYAVATLAPSQTTCAIPIGVCKEAGGGSAPTFGLVAGKWYGGKFGPDESGASYTGSYNWIDFTVQGGWEPEDKQCVSGGGGGGADEIKCLLEGPGQCELPPLETPVGQQGQIGSAAQSWNTRFGLYLGNPKIEGVLAQSPPDFTGAAYTKIGVGAATATTWPNSAPQNAYSGTYSGTSASGTMSNYQQAKEARSPYDLDLNPAGITGDASYNSATPEQLASYGSQRRVALAPIVNCTDLAGSNPQTVKVEGYACVLMLAPIKAPSDVVLEYLGPANDSNSPCSSYGVAGSSTGPLVPVLVQ